MVKVLYVWNTAGASTPISDWLNLNGHQSTIIMHSDYDGFGMTSKAISSILPTTLKDYYEAIVRTIKTFQPTHIHINSNRRALPIARAAAPRTPIIFQYHGDDVRFRKKVHREVRFLSDKIIVSTPDLQRFGRVFRNPVDIAFSPKGGRMEGTALFLIGADVYTDKMDLVTKYCLDHNLELTVIDCRKGERVPFSEMPELLSKYEPIFS